MDAVQELDHVGAGPVGYWGMSLGCGLGVPFIAAEPRIRAAMLGLNGAEISAEATAQITVPLEFLVQWDDERVPRTASLALFDPFASAEKTLHANPGKNAEVPMFELDSTLRTGPRPTISRSLLVRGEGELGRLEPCSFASSACSCRGCSAL